MTRTTSRIRIALWAALLVGSAAGAGTAEPVPQWSPVSVQLPSSTTGFPAGAGADIANAQCLMCHSTGMVLRQPPQTEPQWTAIVRQINPSVVPA